MMGALTKDKRGIVSWDGERCVGCRYCQVACPFNIPRFEWNNALDPRIVKCEMCWPRQNKGEKPACVESCPAEAVIFGKREELLKDAKQRIADAPDDYFPKILGERDAGGTQVLMLSPVDFRELGIPDVGTQPIPKVARDVQGSLYYGFIAPAVVYGVLAAVVWRNHRLEEKRDAESAIGPGQSGAGESRELKEGEKNVGPR
jgi:ferredoxin